MHLCETVGRMEVSSSIIAYQVIGLPEVLHQPNQPYGAGVCETVYRDHLGGFLERLRRLNGLCSERASRQNVSLFLQATAIYRTAVAAPQRPCHLAQPSSMMDCWPLSALWLTNMLH